MLWCKMEARDGRSRRQSARQDHGTEMDVSRSPPAEDEGEVDLAGGGREVVWGCK